MYKAKFKTAYLQRELPENAIVVGDCEVGELVVMQSATDVLPAVITKIAGTGAAGAAKEVGTHIVAQSDTTLEYGHVPVENRDYRPSFAVKSTVDTTYVTPDNVKFHGVFAGTSALPSSASVVSAGDTALVYNGTNKVFKLYTASVESSTVSWSEGTYSVDFADAFKLTATFKVTNKDDIIVYEA